MATYFWRYLMLCSFLLILFMESRSQNLCPNPSFEFFNTCPPHYTFFPGEQLTCVPWIPATLGTSDYFNACADPYPWDISVWVPNNFIGNEYGHYGKGYVGLFARTEIYYIREYVMAPLLAPLVAGQYYHFSMYVSLAELSCGVDHIGAYFSVETPEYDTNDDNFIINVLPQVDYEGSYLSNTEGWTLIEGCFEAQGGEKYVTIGNFHTNADSSLDPNCPNNIYTSAYFASSYYYIDDVSLVAIQHPMVDIGPDTIICESQLPYVLNVGTSGGNHFVWQNGTTSDTMLVTGSGIYSVTVSNECISIVDQVEVKIEPSTLEVNLPSDQVLCQGQAFVISNSGDLGEYLWQDGSTTGTLMVNAPGIYSLTVTTHCATASDSVQINYTPPLAIPNLGTDFALCPGQQATLVTGIVGVFYLWQDGSTADTFIVTAPGDYTVKVYDLCSSALDTIHVSFNDPPPELALQPQIMLCQDSSVILTAEIAGVTYLWNDGSEDSTLTVTNAGTYSLTVSNSCGSDIDTVNVIDAGSPPLVSLGNDVTVCPYESYNISPVYFNVDNWLWQDGSTSNEYTVTGAGLVYVTVTNGCGYDYDTLISTFLLPTPSVNLGPDTFICPGDSLLLSITIPDVSVSWSDGSTNAQLQINNSGFYAVTITDACGNDKDTIHVTELPPAPSLDLGPSQFLCPGEDININPGILNVDYLWQDGSTATSFDAMQAGNIILTVSNSCGFAADTLMILYGTPPDTDLGRDTTLCNGMTLMLTSMSEPNTTLSWQNGSSSPTFIVSSPGIYTLSESNNCGHHTDSIQVMYLNSPDPFDLGPDTILCPGQSLILSVPQNGFTIQWQDSSTNSTLLADKAQSYSLQLSNQCGFASDQLTLAYDNDEPFITLDSLYRYCPGNLLILNAGQLFLADYMWSTGSTEASITVVDPGVYTVTVIAPCSTLTKGINVIAQGDCFTASPFIPNVFSPNSDGINDLFSIHTNPDMQINALHVSIFDRWGNLIFDSTDSLFAWDGRFHDDLMAPGVYLYLIIMDYSINGRTFQNTLAGDVTIVR